MWPIFHVLNDWCIIEVKPATKKGDHKDNLHAPQDVVLESLVTAMIGEEVKEGNIGVFAAAEDPESDAG
jgi:hypothetical protein